MRDALGGVVNLAMIVVFLVLVCGYLAFNVNYTKAFRVKNYIITSLEQYEGNCNTGTSCSNKIQSYIKQVGYSAPEFKIEDYTCNYGYCYKEFKASNEVDGSVSESKDQVYYRVVTQINIDIPIINRIMPGLKIFQISGNTKLITPFK